MGDVMHLKMTKKFNQGTDSSGLKWITALCCTTISRGEKKKKNLLIAAVSADRLWSQCYSSVIVAYCLLMNAIFAIVWTVKYGY